VLTELADLLGLTSNRLIYPTTKDDPCSFSVIVTNVSLTGPDPLLDTIEELQHDYTQLERSAHVNIQYFIIERDLCPNDPLKTNPGICGCGLPDYEPDGVTRIPNCGKNCPDFEIDSDGDGVPNCLDGCPYNSDLIEPGPCLCSACPGHLLELTSFYARNTRLGQRGPKFLHAGSLRDSRAARREARGSRKWRKVL